MRALLTLSLVCLTTLSYGQTIDKFVPFNVKDYPKDKYHLMSNSFKLRNLIIRIRQVSPLQPLDYNSIDNSFFYCRAWLTVSKDNKPIYQRFFKSIEPLGGCSGLFIPSIQPRKDYFVIIKYGDYDGRIFIIDSLGNVSDKIGGSFWLSNNKRYLFSEYNSDLYGLTVFDFSCGRCLFSDTTRLYFNKWYFQDNKYVSRGFYDNNGKDSCLATFDLFTNKLIISKSNQNKLKPKNCLPSYEIENLKSICNCGQ
jgi:hypothetical protein